ncbi:hypothetical protein ACFQ60_03505 [Streptomyces zhihengii]|uniref:hypothetical protein n=1 Tax=Streptomyces zhihengii TaxID=1818004 RepID=UPI001FD1C3A4|nr:hypothetical protein [Streptomyces zhihengii]
MTQPAAVNRTKASRTVSLDKHGVTSGLIKVNLNWTSSQAAAHRAADEAHGLPGQIRASLRSAAARHMDLDLGCMILRPSRSHDPKADHWNGQSMTSACGS